MTALLFSWHERGNNKTTNTTTANNKKQSKQLCHKKKNIAIGYHL